MFLSEKGFALGEALAARAERVDPVPDFNKRFVESMALFPNPQVRIKQGKPLRYD